MFKKTIAFAAAAVLALSMIATGCGKVEESSITMDMSDEKAAIIEFSNAKEEEYVQGGYLHVEEGEGIEVTSNFNEGGKVLIDFIAAEGDQSKDVLPDMNSSYEMMISGVAIQGATFDSGDYDLKITVQDKATGTLTLSVKPADEIVGMEAEELLDDDKTANAEGGHTNWTQAATAEEAAKGAGIDVLADLNGTQTSMGVLGEMGAITYRYMDGVAQIFCPVAAVDMSVIKGKIPSGVD